MKNSKDNQPEQLYLFGELRQQRAPSKKRKTKHSSTKPEPVSRKLPLS